MSRAWSVSVTCALGVALAASLAGSWRATRRAEDEAKRESLERLQEALRGGPLELAEVRPGRCEVTSKAAGKAAAEAVGLPAAKPARAWPVEFTDREFIGGAVLARPCWLVECDAGDLFPGNRATKPRTGYAVVDGGTGVILEFFTPPEGRWWERVRVRGEEAVAENSGQRSRPARGRPRTTLRRLAEIASEEIHESILGRAQQFIARFMEYTDLNTGTVIDRGGAPEMVPKQRDDPTWVLSVAGVRMKDRGFVREEWNLIVRSETGRGECFYTYR